MATPEKTNAKTLRSKFWGADWIQSIPPFWRSALKSREENIPGVPLDTNPEEVPEGVLPTDGEIVVASQTTQTRTNELDKKTTYLDADLSTRTAHGQRVDEETGAVLPFTRRLIRDGEEAGTPNAEIEPYNPLVSQIEELDIDALDAFAATWKLIYPDKINVDLPDLLLSVDGIIDEVVGQGETSETGDVVHSGDYSDGLDFHASAQSSVIITPDAFPDVRQFWGVDIDCTMVHFLLKSPVSKSQVIDRLEELLEDTLSAWPKYSPKPVTIRCVGRRMSLQVTATSKGSRMVRSGDNPGSSHTFGGGVGFSQEAGLQQKIIRIPGTIHAALTIGGQYDGAQAIAATAEAEATGFADNFSIDASDGGTVQVDPILASVRNAATGSRSIPASPGGAIANAWPATGLNLKKTNARPWRRGYIMFMCAVVDADDLPTTT